MKDKLNLFSDKEVKQFREEQLNDLEIKRRLDEYEKRVKPIGNKELERLNRLSKQKEYYQKNEARKREYNSRPEVKAKIKEYRKRPEVREKLRLKRKEYYQRPEVKARKREYNSRPEVKEHRKKRFSIWQKKRYKEDDLFNINMGLRSNVNRAFNHFMKTKKIWKSSKYGIDYKTIIEHLKPFPKDISKYHIDHIKPLSSFNFVNEDGTQNLKEIKKAFNPKNHQWLLIKDNLKKGKKIV